MKRIFLIFIFLVFNVVHSESGDEENVVLVYTNPNGDHKDYRSHYTIPIDETLEEVDAFSVCLWINPYRYSETCLVLSIYCNECTRDSGPSLTLRMRNEYLTVVGSTVIDFIKLETYSWQHLCILHGKNVSIYFNQTIHEFIPKEDFIPMKFQTNLEIEIGADNVEDDSFSGFIAGVRFYWRLLESREIESITKFIDTSTDYSILADLENLTYYHLNGNYLSSVYKPPSNLTLKTNREALTYASSDFFVTLFDVEVSCKKANETCKKFGGHLLTYRNSDDLNSIYKYLYHHLTIAINNPVNIFWVEKITSTSQKCVKGVFKINKEKVLISNSTVYSSLNPVCVLNKNQPLYVKTLGKKYTLYPVPNADFVFETRYEWHRLYWPVSERVTMQYMRLSRPVAELLTMNDKDTIIGRREWTLSLFKNKKELIVVSICTEQQFTCSSGECVDMTKICNFKPDCHDASDEGFCDVGVSPPDTYVKQLSPATSANDKTKLLLRLQLYRVIDIQMDDNIVYISLSMEVGWRDWRLRFKNLQDNLSMFVHNDISKKLWQPKITLENVIDQDHEKFHLDSYPSVLSARKLNNGSADIHEGFEVMMYDGEDVQLFHKKTDPIRVNCKMNLYTFPFDTQTCFFNLVVNGIIYQDIEWSRERDISIRSGKEQLNLYSDLSFGFLQQQNMDNKKLTVVMTFKRKYGAYLFNIFLPCSILESIGLLTPLLPSHDYQDRVAVTLSCLIVMVALFTQVSTSLPPSADPKLIDVWMFTHLFILFMVFIVHVMVIVLHNEYNNQEKQHNLDLTSDLDGIPLPAKVLNTKIKIAPRLVTDEDIKRYQARKNEKNKMKSYTKANMFGMIFCVAFYILFITIYFAEIMKE